MQTATLERSGDALDLTAGPLQVELLASDAELRDAALQSLELFGVDWASPLRRVRIRLDRRAVDKRAEGSFLTCARMNVDASEALVFASTISGICTIGFSLQHFDTWQISAPWTAFTEPVVGDIEDLLGLALPVGWRREGWVPVHAAAVEKDGRCLILCAPSGGGKSTMTTALMRNGWRTLGDDKLLLRCDGATPSLHALLATFNLHPQTTRWFSEIGDLEELQRYSAWTDKRRVSVDRIAPGASAVRARPTHVVRLSRNPGGSGIAVRPLRRDELLATLLRQIVVPRRPEVARQIVATAAATVAAMTGIDVAVGDDAYQDSAWLRKIERAL